MRARRTGLRYGLLAGVTTLAMLLAACGDDDDDGGTEGGAEEGGDLSGETVTILGPEVGAEADGITAAFAPFEESSGVNVEYTGTRDAETQVRTASEAGGDALPDIFFAPQPGLVQALADQITPVTGAVADTFGDTYDPYLAELVTVDGNILGVPVKADLKSLVWYNPKVFDENGYAVPATFDELVALQDQARGDGITPWCVGIESGEATGWVFTDWVEDMMLRLHGPDVYDQWVNHEIPFNDPQVKEAVEAVGNIWFEDGNVLNGRQSIPSTGFANAGLPILDGQCLMYRISNFYGVNLKDANPDAVLGEGGDASVFYFPTVTEDFGNVTLSGGVYAVAFNDDPATVAALEYLASTEFANARIEAQGSGFLSPNKDVDTSLYSEALDTTMAEILVAADPVRFDASDLMPGEVGAGTFWRDGTNYVAGTEDVDTFLDNVEASWPAS
jgi:alpha-glucoside transport system substrate-binding protein